MFNSIKAKLPPPSPARKDVLYKQTSFQHSLNVYELVSFLTGEVTLLIFNINEIILLLTDPNSCDTDIAHYPYFAGILGTDEYYLPLQL